MKEDLIKAVKAALLPELAELKTALTLTNQRLDDTNKRLDDMNAHLVDQSRRIDAVREELGGRIDAVRQELSSGLNATNKRLDQLYDVIVRRDEHQQLVQRMDRIEQEMTELKKRFAA